jgi:hypothetical protein
MVVARLSDRFTVPKKLTVRGTPREIGLTIGHVARQAGQPLPLVSTGGRALNQQIVDLYRRVYPAHLEVVAGIAAVSDARLDEVDMVQMEYGYFLRLWWSLLKYERFVSLTDFGHYGDSSPAAGCSVASFLNGSRHGPPRRLMGPARSRRRGPVDATALIGRALPPGVGLARKREQTTADGFP